MHVQRQTLKACKDGNSMSVGQCRTKKGTLCPKEDATGSNSGSRGPSAAGAEIAQSPPRWRRPRLAIDTVPEIDANTLGRIKSGRGGARRSPAVASLALMLWANPQAAAQTVDRGLRVEGVSLSETYFAQGVPSGLVTYGDVFLGSGLSLTGATSIKWTKARHRSFTVLRLTPTYGRRFGDLESPTWNGTLSLRHSRILGRKWMMDWFGSAQVMNFDEALYGESTLTQIASTAITFDDLTGAVLHGNSSDQANTTAYSSLHPSSVQDFLLGRRMANGDVTAKLTYAYSPRLSISALAGGMLARHLKDSSDPSGFLYPQVDSIATGISATYALSRRTQIGVSANTVRNEVLNSGKLTSNEFSGSINRIISRRWFVQASLGLGSESEVGFRHLDNRYSAGLGFKTFSHTALITCDRGLNDPYASALATLKHSRSLTGTWHYARPGSPWSINSAFSQLIAIYRGVPGTNTWSITQTVSRRMSRNYSAALQYTMGRVGAKRYIQDGHQYQLEETGIRATLLWSPQHRAIGSRRNDRFTGRER